MSAASSAQPLVSVITPVYNGAAYLAGCIESVLAQTYSNWDYLIVDNRSTDGSLEIAQQYAARDSRIRVITNPEHVGVIQNHNIAFRKISPDACYCKVAQADDLLLPECLSQMVALAAAYPSVGLVSSYSLLGTRIRGDGLPYPSPIVSGREICRQALLGKLNILFGPTTLMFRADFVRRADAFFNEAHLHSDTEVCFTVLRDSDLGFVHQVLTYCRVHDTSASATTAVRLNTYDPAWLEIVQRHGPTFLSPEEYERTFAIALDNYYRFLGMSLFWRRGKRFWEFHRGELQRIGHPLSVARLLRSAVRVTGSVFMRRLRDRRRSLALSR